MTINRRDVMKRAGQAVAAGAVLPFLSPINPTQAQEDADTALFNLVDQYETATKKHDQLKKAWCEAIRPYLAPVYGGDPHSDPQWGITRASRTEKARALEMEMEWARQDYHSAAICIVKTPARSMRGVAAKMRISEGGTKWRGLMESALADAERLAGRAA